MEKYINAEKLKLFLHPENFGTPDEQWRPESEWAALIDAIPTEDVAPIVHAKWIEYIDPNFEAVCIDETPIVHAKWDENFDADMPCVYSYCRTPGLSCWKYCCECGAKMDIKESEVKKI